jgi:hypothetical protein
MAKPLDIYLNDHLGGATFGVALTRRMHRENRGSPYEASLARMAREIGEDRGELEAIMARLGVRKRRFKLVGGWIAERTGRLKPNGRLVGYTPLGRMLELEQLVAGVEGKLSLWRALKQLAPAEGCLDPAILERLEERARDQIGLLRAEHELAAREALIGSTPT